MYVYYAGFVCCLRIPGMDMNSAWRLHITDQYETQTLNALLKSVQDHGVSHIDPSSLILTLKTFSWWKLSVNIGKIWKGIAMTAKDAGHNELIPLYKQYLWKELERKEIMIITWQLWKEGECFHPWVVKCLWLEWDSQNKRTCWYLTNEIPFQLSDG